MKEHFKVVGDDPLYLVSDMGRVWSKLNGCLLKIFRMSKNGVKTYECVSLTGRKNFLVHRLVAIAHIPNPEGKPCVHHKNGNKLDNREANLEWVTIAENNRFKIGGRYALKR